MLKKTRSVSLRIKITLMCLTITLLALVFQTIFFQYSSSKLVYEQAVEAGINSLSNMQENLANFLKNTEDRMATIYNQVNFIDDLASGMPISELRDRYGNEIYFNLAHNFAISAFHNAFNVKALYIYTANHEIIGSYRVSYSPKYSYPSDIYNTSYPNNTEIIREYMQSDDKTMLVTSYYHETIEEDLVRFVYKILYNNGTRTIGYIVCETDQRPLNKIMSKYVYSDSQIIWLQAKGDRPIALIGNMSPEQKSYFSHISNLVQNNSELIENDTASNGSVFFSVPNQKYHLIAFSLTPQELLARSQKVLTRNLVIIAFLVIFVFTSASVVLSKTITGPLTEMVETIKEIRRGNTALRVKNYGKDEIGELGENFNNMLDTIETLMFEKYQIHLEANNAKYKALQAQVNPHFLYNTLDTMSAIATSQNCNTVSMLSKALSNLFRYSLDMEEPLSTIEDEIKHLKNYIYIMNVRENNSIHFEINIDSNLLKESIPKLSLQPLVENSIQHGLRNKRGEKKIWITGKLNEDGDIVISVHDNGVGMDAEQINSQLENPRFDALEVKKSIGLSNINARVKILFGNNYGVKIYSKSGEGSVVTLLIPRRKTA